MTLKLSRLSLFVGGLVSCGEMLLQEDTARIDPKDQSHSRSDRGQRLERIGFK